MKKRLQRLMYENSVKLTSKVNFYCILTSVFINFMNLNIKI